MNQKNCHAIPLVEMDADQDINIRGIITSDDLVGVYDDTVDIRQVMSEKVVVTHPNSSAASAAKMMLRHGIHHLIVMEQEEIVGMLSSFDFVQLIAERES
jgi:CBS domain-containing protein